MSKFNKKLPPLLIAGATVFLLGTAYKFVFGKKTKPSALDASPSDAALDGTVSDEQNLEPQQDLSASATDQLQPTAAADSAVLADTAAAANASTAVVDELAAKAD